MGVELWTKSGHGVGESLGSLVLRARLIACRSSWEAGGVGGPRAHASRTASTSAASAVAAGDSSGPGDGGSDESSVVGMARALLTGTAHGFAEAAVEGASSLSSVSRMVMVIFSRLTTSQNVSRALQNADTADNRLGLQLCLQRQTPPRRLEF